MRESLVVPRRQHIRGVCRGDRLQPAIRGLLLDQFRQQPNPRRMNPAVDLLEKVKSRRILVEHRRQRRQKAQRAVGNAVRRKLPILVLADDELDAARSVGGKLEIRDIQRCQFLGPGNEIRFALRVGADAPQHRGQVRAAVVQHGLAGNDRFPHAIRREIPKAHLPEHRGDVPRGILMPPADPALFRDLRQRRLVGAHGDPQPFLLLARFPHAQQEMRAVLLLLHRVRRFRMAGINRFSPNFQMLFEHPEVSCMFRVGGHADGVLDFPPPFR